MLSACVSQSSYDALQAQNQQLQAQNRQLQAQVAGLEREASFLEAGDLLFPEGGYQLSAAGKMELNNNIVPKLTGLQNAKIVVYGYTDNLPVGPQLQRAGINDNLTLSSRRPATLSPTSCRRRIVGAAEDAARVLAGEDPVDPSHPVTVPTEAAYLRQKVRGRAVLREGRGGPAACRIVAAEYPARAA